MNEKTLGTFFYLIHALQKKNIEFHCEDCLFAIETELIHYPHEWLIFSLEKWVKEKPMRAKYARQGLLDFLIDLDQVRMKKEQKK